MLEETGVDPFPQGFSSTLSQLAMEQDFATDGNDDFSAVTWKAALRLSVEKNAIHIGGRVVFHNR